MADFGGEGSSHNLVFPSLPFPLSEPNRPIGHFAMSLSVLWLIGICIWIGLNEAFKSSSYNI